MPVSIGDVQSEVLVDPPSGEQGGGNERKTLPTQQELARWAQMHKRHLWDETRTCARDFDD